MFVYEKKLQYPVRITNPNPQLAAVIISQYGGPDGELGASLRYLSQRYSMPYPELKGLLTDIGTEELGHLEMVGTIVHQLTRTLTQEQIASAGFAPYYLYRQKYMSGSFENTGWCRPGYTGLYNIYMMEELHTILSLGGGGMNKINLPEEKLARYHNPKIPQDYISRIDTILQQKDEIFSILREIREQNP